MKVRSLASLRDGVAPRGRADVKRGDGSLIGGAAGWDHTIERGGAGRTPRPALPGFAWPVAFEGPIFDGRAGHRSAHRRYVGMRFL